jgi:arginase
MSPLVVFPFHQDQRLSDASIPMPPTIAASTVEPALPIGDQWQRLATLYDVLAHEVASTITTPGLTTVLTGDCLAMLGTLAGAQRADLDPSVVWFDAHGDVHTLSTSTSGYLGGMALRMAMGGDQAELAGPLGIHPLPEDRAVLVDARDLDPAEAEYLATSHVRQHAVEDIDVHDLPDGPVLLHIDLDVINPAELPGLRFPAPGGPTKYAFLTAVQRLLASGRVAIRDIACPWFEPATRAHQAIRRTLLDELLGSDQ